MASSVALDLSTQFYKTGSSYDTVQTNGSLGSQTSDIWISRTDDLDIQTYTLDVYAGDLSGDLTSFDIDLTYDATKFDIVEFNDIGIYSSFDVFNSAALSDDNSIANAGKIRVVGGSAGSITTGNGILASETGDDRKLFSINFTVNDANTSSEVSGVSIGYEDSQYSDSTGFSLSVNSNDTVMQTNAGTSSVFANLTTGSVTSSDISIVEMTSNLGLTSDVDFVTDRIIATSDSTNLVREGDTIASKGTIAITNTGYVSATNFDFAISSLDSDASFQLTSGETKSSTSLTDQNIASGSTTTYGLEMSVTGSAGDIIDFSSTEISATDITGDTETISMGATKNLITYQADINYDGRVSMMDLATLNAGAEDGTNHNSVDVNYDKTISIADLEKMDEQWGSSLHSTLMTGNTFTGNTGEGSIDLSSTDYVGGSTSNSEFITQNSTENTVGFIDSLVDTGGVWGYDSNTTSADTDTIYDDSADGLS